MASSKLLQIISFITLFCLFNCTFTNQYRTTNTEIWNDTYGMKSHNFVAVVDGDSIVFRVVNGQVASLGDVPYQIALMVKVGVSSTYQATCGGSIIGPKKVLTAAHCVYKRKLSDCYKGYLSRADLKSRRVVAGQLRTRAKFGFEGQWRKIASGKYPRKYKFPKNDIAVLYLVKKFNYNSDVQPVAVASRNIDYRQDCTASGYGRINSRVQSSVLLLATLRTLSRKMCNKIHRRNFAKFVCTSDQTSDVHKGDSGGPLVCKGTGDPAEINSPKGIVVGVVSGRDMAQHMGTFFTRVSSYYEFVSCAPKFKATTWFLLCFVPFYQ